MCLPPHMLRIYRYIIEHLDLGSYSEQEWLIAFNSLGDVRTGFRLIPAA